MKQAFPINDLIVLVLHPRARSGSFDLRRRTKEEKEHRSYGSLSPLAMFPWMFYLLIALTLPSLAPDPVCAQFTPALRSAPATRGDEQLTAYLSAEVRRVSEQCLSGIETVEDWKARRGVYRRQLQEMLGLWPMPERTDLKAVVTGTLDHEAFTVEKLHFQASPKLYCTANLYIPKGINTPAPTVLYACGHWKLVRDGISYGNKAVYQVDGAWFARNGYVCLVLDTLLAGEIQGIHTGTRDHGLWWWNSRGYTPAGVEAWFGIRALDYLSSRPEVDTNRFGITGHSGGGAYSWTVTALDDRVKVAAPLAGMTTLEYHALHNLMDSHCDCNFPINIYRWDFPQLAAMAAPRPLLIGGTDNDGIFPLESTLRIHKQVRDVYRLLDAGDQLGLAIAPGGHDEVPELRLAVMRWFNRHLRGIDKKSEPPIVMEAKRFFEPEELKVFNQLPADSVNADIAETFVPRAKSQKRTAGALRDLLNRKVFAGWPEESLSPEPTLLFDAEKEGLRLHAWEILSQHDVPLRLYLLARAHERPLTRTSLKVLDESGWDNWLETVGTVFAEALWDERQGLPNPQPDKVAEVLDSVRAQLSTRPGALAFFAPRGVGLTAWSGDEKRLRRLRRRFMIMGQTVDGMRVWDIRQAMHALREVNPGPERVLRIEAQGDMTVNALYAALYEPSVYDLILPGLPESHLDGPDYLGVLKVTDIPEVLEAIWARTDAGSAR